ncbi:uncharacterized protein LOC592569 [Strongylocentrotus purpuratus]|uniref:Integral membrane protein 2 n=1 Tax=Strongylocentrotus purpuratus TaxID=7668 RepID=A0A7M7NJS3_STRPU|nr:uncharacterized protein LOC592569 [Strongylocentrotus purpuratus]
MTIYKTEARIYSPKIVEDASKASSQPLEQCRDCTGPECREGNCQFECDCEAGSAVRVVRRQARPCSTWALAAICTVTVGLCIVLAGLLYVATRSTMTPGFCKVIFPPYEFTNETCEETIGVEEQKQIETIDIPKFNSNHHITVMADFSIHMTAFRDNEDKRCFLMNHTNSLFESPSNLLEFMRDYRNGAHLTQLKTIYAKMQVQGPAINMTVVATSIQTHCFQISTFWLHSTQIIEEGGLVKRSVDSEPSQSLVFCNGKDRVHVDIMGA